MNSLTALLRGQSTVVQYDLLMRADRLFAHLFADGRGRFYGGLLTEGDVSRLTEGVRLKGEDDK
jgi:hypothetical protein